MLKIKNFLVLFITLSSILPYNFSYAENSQDWSSSELLQHSYWISQLFPSSLNHIKSIIAGVNHSGNKDVYQFDKDQKVYGLTIYGSAQFDAKNSLIRVVLVDKNLQEYLIYEAFPLIVNSNYFSFNNICEESCSLNAVEPQFIKIHTVKSSIQIDKISLIESTEIGNEEFLSAQRQIKVAQDREKIKIINRQIKKEGMKWIAGETSISRLFYEEKKNFFGVDMIPNLQGAEYYKGGIFEIESSVNSPTLSDIDGSSLIESFDWRNRHGANNAKSPYYDGDPSGSGWITPIKNQGCNHCWAFSAIHATEAIVNLYFNQHVDLDLSEQDVASCSGANSGCCEGGYLHIALDHIIDIGVVDETCFPYSASCESCTNVCPIPDEQIKVNGRLFPGQAEKDIKRAIIDYGPITGGIRSWWHFMVMIGFDKDPDDGQTIWIFKNSWGPGWGDNGYGYLKVDLSDLYGRYALTTPVVSLLTNYEIECKDMDGDGYYYWGISEQKPSACSVDSRPKKDCDDSNPQIGPMDSNGYCLSTSQSMPWMPLLLIDN